MNTNPNGSQLSSDAGRSHKDAGLQAHNANVQPSMSGNGKQSVLSREAQNRQTASTSAQNSTPVLPAVDIFEDETGVTIMADLPGVSREGLGVRIDGENLVIEGAAKPDEMASSGDMEIIYGEVLNPFYRRSFTLSRDLDASRIEAKLNHGVLKLTIPKAEAAKPRRIEVNVG